MRAGVGAAVATVLLLAVGCRETEWPSDADQEAFCALVGDGSAESLDLEALQRVGTPDSLPHEARRYLLDLAEGETTQAEGETAFTAYVDDYCR